MALAAGTRLGPYEILSPLGAGGMGVVYCARDVKLGREVALKFLPEAFSEDRDRLARFEREARLLAYLNHPNIATLHGLEEVDGGPHRSGLSSARQRAPGSLFSVRARSSLARFASARRLAAAGGRSRRLKLLFSSAC